MAVLLAGLFVLARHQAPAPAARPDADDAQQKVRAAPSSAAGPSVTLDAQAQRKGGIDTVPLRATTYQDRVQAFGTVLPLDRLTTLYNASLTASADLQSAQAKAFASNAANERAQKLLKIYTTAVAQAEAADASYKIDLAGVRAVEAQVAALNNTAIQDWGSTLGNAIVSRSDTASTLVQRKATLVRISLQSGALTKPPQTIMLEAGEAPGIAATYLAEAPQVDPKAQTVGFLYTAPASPSLVPGLSLVAQLPVGPAQPGYAFPSSAVVWQGGRAWIYLKTAPETFVREPLAKSALTTANGGFIVPADSLRGGDVQLVSEGAQALLSEESRSQFRSSADDDP